MSEDINNAVVPVVATGGSVTQVTSKLLGATSILMSDGFKEAWAISWQKIMENAATKTPDLDDGKATNLRVTCEVFRHGSITDDPICIDYFGGILAASRSTDGKNDTAIHYLDCIKAMSAKQLHLHYAIYSSAQRLFVKSGKHPNVMQGSELTTAPVWLSSIELSRLGLQQDFDLPVLHRLGLVSEYKTDVHRLQDNQVVPYSMLKITTFGVLLYCAAMNKLLFAREFPFRVFEGNPEIAVPQCFGATIEGLIQAGERLASPTPANAP